jgi:hypothetical protein
MKQLVLVLVLLAGCRSTPTNQASIQDVGSACGMQLNDTPVIFCDTFDQPAPVNSRSGQLDGVVWGVSRQAGGENVWADTVLEGCHGPQPASSIGATDVIICNGQLRQAVNDNHDITVLAAYPKQPFNFANRTGTVSFDVSNDTTGPHGAWPEFWISDQPVPVPFTYYNPCGVCLLPRHGLGIRFEANECQPGGGWRVGSVVAVRNYVPEDRTYYENNPTGMKVSPKGCASLSTGPNGGLNHIEVRISKDRIDVYASDAGQTAPLKILATVTDADLSLTQGLIWITDGHYNAEKAAIPGNPLFPDLRMHTFTWDNVAFDGPATYRDLSFDVLDGTEVVGTALNQRVIRTGWFASPAMPADLTTLPMTAANIAAATGAWLTFSWGKEVAPTAFAYTVNGHPSTMPIPPNLALAQPIGMRSLAMPVPLAYLVPGAQRIQLSSDVARLQVQNVNIVLVAAAPVPGNPLPPTTTTMPPPTTTTMPVTSNAACQLVVRVNGVTQYVDAPSSFCAGGHP